jgi:AcrR family transcriptional regulator
MPEPIAPVPDARAPRSQRRPVVEARLIAAVEQLAADGAPFSEVSVARLVAAAGLGRATFYLYFPDRSSFLLRLADHARDVIAEPLARLWGDLGRGIDRTMLEAVLHDIVHRFHDHRTVISAVIEAASTDPVIASRLDEAMRTFIAACTCALETAQRDGSVRPGLACAETAAALSWMVERTCYQLARDAAADHLDRLALSLADIAWRALHD